jgi:hypothetical protein
MASSSLFTVAARAGSKEHTLGERNEFQRGSCFPASLHTQLYETIADVVNQT